MSFLLIHCIYRTMRSLKKSLIMIWVHREHSIPVDFVRRVRKKYMRAISDGVFPTLDDMNDWICTHSVHSDSVSPTVSPMTVVLSFSIPFEVADACVAAESLQQYTKDLKPTVGGNVEGTMIEKSEMCVVCRAKGRFKIECGHVFHRKCILECTKWKNECPVCQSPLMSTLCLCLRVSLQCIEQSFYLAPALQNPSENPSWYLCLQPCHASPLTIQRSVPRGVEAPIDVVCWSHDCPQSFVLVHVPKPDPNIFVLVVGCQCACVCNESGDCFYFRRSPWNFSGKDKWFGCFLCPRAECSVRV